MATAPDPTTTSPLLRAGAITHSPRGTIVEILEASPERLRAKRTYPPNTGKGADHFHEHAVETFTILEGEATGSVDRDERQLKVGDVLKVPRGSRHVHPHTGDGQTLVLEHAIEPFPEFERLFVASWLQWLEVGDLDDQDEVKPLQIMALIKDSPGGAWVSGVPIPAQKGLAQVLGRVANLTGVKPYQA